MLKENISLNPYMHGLSDILSGATNNVYALKYSHSNEYWDLGPHKLSSEAFAHFYEAYIRNDIKKINLYRTYLPRAFSLFLNMVKNIYGGDTMNLLRWIYNYIKYSIETAPELEYDEETHTYKYE